MILWSPLKILKWAKKTKEKLLMHKILLKDALNLIVFHVYLSFSLIFYRLRGTKVHDNY